MNADERAFFLDARPAGYIMFKRNIVDRAQLRALTDSLRTLEGREDTAILIDQEGGRVARMTPPEWPAFPPGGAFDALYRLAPISAIEAVRANMHALGLTLAEAGITVDCAPLLDVVSDETHAAIGDRAFGRDPLQVAALGRAALDGLAAAGVVGVVKHMPGQGRAKVDSHRELPRVEASREALERDFAPFAALSDAAMGMTAHVVYPAIDADRPATLSPIVIDDVIRRRIGFDGLLMSDDLDMDALSGTIADRAAGCVAAGCDVALNCWGRMSDMVAIAGALPSMSEKAMTRLARAMATVDRGADLARLPELLAKRDALLALA